MQSRPSPIMSFLTSRFLTLNSTGIACEEAFVLQCLLVIGIDLNQCAGDCKTQSLALSGVTTAVKIYLNVIFAFNTQELQRLLYNILQNS